MWMQERLNSSHIVYKFKGDNKQEKTWNNADQNKAY